MKTAFKKRTIKAGKKKPTKKSVREKERAEACELECKIACGQRQVMEDRLRDIATSNVALHVQNNEQRQALQNSMNALDEAASVVSTAKERLDDARATLEIFCGSNLGVDIRQHFNKCEVNDFHNVLNVHTSQQQVCAKAVARLASMLYTILTREL